MKKLEEANVLCKVDIKDYKKGVEYHVWVQQMSNKDERIAIFLVSYMGGAMYLVLDNVDSLKEHFDVEIIVRDNK